MGAGWGRGAKASYLTLLASESEEGEAGTQKSGAGWGVGLGRGTGVRGTQRVGFVGVRAGGASQEGGMRERLRGLGV